MQVKTLSFNPKPIGVVTSGIHKVEIMQETACGTGIIR